VKKIYNSILEILLACASSCFPAIDSFTDDEDDDNIQTEQNKVMEKTKDKYTLPLSRKNQNLKYKNACIVRLEKA